MAGKHVTEGTKSHHYDENGDIIGESVIFTDKDDGKKYTLQLDKGVLTPVEVV